MNNKLYIWLIQDLVFKLRIQLKCPDTPSGKISKH